jgi:hypothetical protein
VIHTVSMPDVIPRLAAGRWGGQVPRVAEVDVGTSAPLQQTLPLSPAMEGPLHVVASSGEVVADDLGLRMIGAEDALEVGEGLFV